MAFSSLQVIFTYSVQFYPTQVAQSSRHGSSPIESLEHPCDVGQAKRWQLAHGHSVNLVANWEFEQVSVVVGQGPHFNNYTTLLW